MKAEVIHEYGGPLQFENAPDPAPQAGQILIRVAATSVNPVDMKRISGEAKERFPLHFPDIVGVDVAGTVEEVGSGVTQFKKGDKVFAMAQKTYAELCAVDANAVACVPDGMDLVEAARVPLVATTGTQLVQHAKLSRGQTVLITGATGSVGRTAVYQALKTGARVLLAVKAEHVDEARKLGAAEVYSTEDDSLDGLSSLDAVCDTVGGQLGEKLIAKVKAGGRFVTVVAEPANAKRFSQVETTRFTAAPDPSILQDVGEALVDGDFEIPIGRRFALKDAGQAQAAFKKGGAAKILLVN